MAWLYEDCLQFIRDANEDDGSSRGTRQAGRIMNDANRAMHEAGDWDFDRSKIRLYYLAAKTDGTVTVAIDGTALTGASTAFAAADLDKFFRIRGEDLQYRVTAAPASATAATIETYRAATAASGSAYRLTQDRVTLPVLFRKFQEPIIASESYALAPVTLDELLNWRMFGREMSNPRICAVEFYTTSVVGVAPAPYLWVYPSPSAKAILDLYVYSWPFEMTTTGDGISAPAQADSCHREYCKAFLLREQNKTQEYVNQLQVADEMTRRALSAFRARGEMGQKEMWSADLDSAGSGVNRRKMTSAPGEPIFQ